MKEIIRLKYVIILFVILVGVLFIVSNLNFKVEGPSLVIFGDNIKTDEKPFVENDGIYLSFKTIKNNIDSDIFFDEISSKVIITNYFNVIKMKTNEKKYDINLEEKEITNEVKKIDSVIYVPINVLKDIYKIDIAYNKDKSSIIINKNISDEGTVLYNKSNVYSSIDKNSSVIDKLNKNDKIIVYTDALNHNRWYKVKTSNNIVGYISKNLINLVKLENKQEEKVVNKKINMYWQYGNSLETLVKVEGVNVVSPTFYELKNVNGDITSKSSLEYVKKAKEFGYKVWPVITNAFDSSTFSTNEVSMLMNSESSREKFIKNILNIVKRDELDGINIDFETMKIEDKDKFSQFIKELAPLLRKIDKTLSVDMYFVAYIDRKEVGKAADYICLMGYDQNGSWSSVSGSVSQVSWVEENIKSLIDDSKINPNKIILGVPFYTRLWTEKSGVSKPTTTLYTMKEQQKYITNNKLKYTYDEKSGQNYIEYSKGSTTYKMWLEDETSIKNRVDLINNYNLGGIAAWRKGFETDDIYKVIKENLKE
jgi:spore germination protein YaaH